MTASGSILLFGDSSDPPVPIIRQLLSKSRSSKNTQVFIQNVVDAVGQEIQKMPPQERNSVGMIHSILDLQECFDNNRDRFGIARTILLFVARIGELILHAERDPSLLMGNDNSPLVVALGICGSLLPAVAAAVANDVGELIEVSTFLATVACRVSVHVVRRSMQIDDSNGAWAFSTYGEVVTRLPSILEQFHKEQVIPQHRRAYIALQAASWATVFGPPVVLNKLIDTSSALRQTEVMMLPAAFGAVHAPHLALPNLEYLIGENPILEKRTKANYKLMSGSTYRPMQYSNLRNLLAEALEEIFQRGTNPERLFEAGTSLLDKDQETALFVLGNTSYLTHLRRTLLRRRYKVAMRSNSATQDNIDGHEGYESIAIVGMSGRFPGSDSIEELWTSIMDKKEFHKTIPSDRFDANSYFDQDGRTKNSMTTAYGCFLEHPGIFDHKMFNIAPREAIRMDPGQRLLMHTTYEALEHAGVTSNGSRATDSKRISTFIGIAGDDWREVQESVGVDVHMVQGTQRAFMPGRLNHYFKWEGATICVDSACGSAATAVGLAFKALINRDCDTAIAGGANIIATPFWHSALSRGGFLSPTGGCKTFREDADGYCRAEAVGVLVLKRLDDALQDNDNIVSVIRGYARNHSAETSSIPHPHVPTQERLYRSLLHKTGLQPDDIDYVECHGTGTVAGDSAELQSIANIFARAGSRENPLLVGAIKANLGHSEATSAIPSIIKAAMILQKGVVPPQVGIPQKLGHYSCLKNGQIMVPGTPMPFSSPTVGQGRKRILVNNFDAAGGNSCFVLEEPPKRPTKGSDPRSFHIVTCSAHSQASLDQNKRSMLQLLKGNGSISLANLSYTTTARRTHHALRAAYCGSSVEDITEALSQDLSHKGQELSNREVKTPVVFVFSGQGVCYAGMGKELFKTSSQFRRIITDLERACRSLGFPSFTNLIAGLDAGMECISIVQLHLSLVALQIALTDLWKIWGVEPDIVMGHSIGEYAALHAAGVLSAFDAMYLVGKRAQLIQSKCFAGTYAMVSISGTTNEVSMLLSEGDFNGCEVACFNSPGMVVFSGERAEILTLESLLKERGFKCQLLEIPYGMHSRQMDAMSSDFGDILAGVRFGEPNVKIVSTFLGHLVTKASSFGRDYFVSHTRDPVKFQQAVESCITGRHADASSIWLEIGPGATCLGLIRANVNIHSSNALASLRKGENNWKTIVASLAAFYSYKKHIHWREYHKDFIDNLSHIDLPRYAFDTKNFWIKYKSNEGLESNGAVVEEDRKSEVISTCLHRRLERPDDEDKQSASFTTTISHLPLMQIIEGHKLSGITVCPAGVFIDMALTAVRNLLTGGDFTSPQPSLSVSDFQINHPVVPVSGSQKVIQVDITRSKRLVTEFSVSFSENSGSLSSTIGKCVVRFRDQSIFDIQHQELFHSIQPKITRLRVASETGLADRIGGKVFYKLFSHLMDYSAAYKGVESAIISGDFKQIIADVRLPLHDRRRLDENFTLSPYWIDILAQSIGFLLNGNPDQTDDYVHIATHIERIDIEARDFAPNVRYRIHAYIDHSKGSDSQGHVFVLHGDTVVGVLEGVAFRKMPRKRFLHILGSTTPMKPNEPAALESGTQPHKSTIQLVSLAATFLKILLEETGMLESELISFALFSEIGVDSMMSISILAGLKAETGIELGASFLTENPTVEDAQRALRMIENQNSTLAERNALTNRHKSGLAPNTLRESNVVLMSGRVDTPSRTPLFLIADGAGSAAAYTHLPELATDLQVFALESPWVHDPESFTCTFSEAAAIYLMAVRTKQPRGPYLLGGWSGGGVFAFEVARLLLEAGEKVSGLIIIDIHAPQHVDRTKVTMPTFELVEQIGMLAGIDRATSGISPQSLERKKHMFNTVRCFSKLDPTPMAPGYQPDATFVIWATENSCLKNRNTMSGSNLDAWFYLSEHDFGPNGWDFLVGDKVECFQVQGDHFSIMNTPRVEQLGRLMQQLVIKCLDSVVKTQD